MKNHYRVDEDRETHLTDTFRSSTTHSIIQRTIEDGIDSNLQFKPEIIQFFFVGSTTKSADQR